MLGDCRTELDLLEEGSVQSCITSPPYWGLRDYGTATWIGGDSNCSHQRDSKLKPENTLTGHKNLEKMNGVGDSIYKTECPKCGAIRKDDQLGLESTPEEYVASMVDVFRAVKRVLKDDGTLWLNLGDTYCGAGHKDDGKDPKHKEGRNWDGHKAPNNKVEGLKPKDLIGIPWRVAFALQADGWYLRQDIIWHKPNPMPEPVKDRCTKSHEYIFLMSKSAKYYYNNDAIKERCEESNIEDYKRRNTFDNKGTGKGSYEEARPDLCRGREAYMPDDFMRNKRDVWTVNTQPYKDAHFATFPTKLIEPCVLAGSQVGDTVLDPFAGSGTTGLVSVENGRNFVGVELNSDYKKLAEQRINTAQPSLFNYTSTTKTLTL